MAYGSRELLHSDLLGTCTLTWLKCCPAVERLHSLAGKADSMIWWPTTQHGLVERANVQVIDSRSGEHFNALSSDQGGHPCIEQRYDGPASWWTQVSYALLLPVKEEGSLQQMQL